MENEQDQLAPTKGSEGKVPSKKRDWLIFHIKHALGFEHISFDSVELA